MKNQLAFAVLTLTVPNLAFSQSSGLKNDFTPEEIKQCQLDLFEKTDEIKKLFASYIKNNKRARQEVAELIEAANTPVWKEGNIDKALRKKLPKNGKYFSLSDDGPRYKLNLGNKNAITGLEATFDDKTEATISLYDLFSNHGRRLNDTFSFIKPDSEIYSYFDDAKVYGKRGKVFTSVLPNSVVTDSYGDTKFGFALHSRSKGSSKTGILVSKNSGYQQIELQDAAVFMLSERCQEWNDIYREEVGKDVMDTDAAEIAKLKK